jgi:hypothetical protein
MDESKIEPRLRGEMRLMEQEDRGGDRISVLVQIAAEEPTAEVTTYAALEKRLRASVGVVKERLTALGFEGKIHENVLAGSLELDLTIDQIAAVSGLAEVKRVILNRVDDVACAQT